MATCSSRTASSRRLGYRTVYGWLKQRPNGAPSPFDGPRAERSRRCVEKALGLPDAHLEEDADGRGERSGDGPAWARAVGRYLASARGRTTPPEVVDRLLSIPYRTLRLNPERIDHVHAARALLETTLDDDPPLGTPHPKTGRKALRLVDS